MDNTFTITPDSSMRYEFTQRSNGVEVQIWERYTDWELIGTKVINLSTFFDLVTGRATLS